MTDVLDTREFYEMCQHYRHSPIGAVEFEELKLWIRSVGVIDKALIEPVYEEDRPKAAA